MTPASIRDGFEQLRSDESMRPLADAAVCRSESDWLVGINGTRAMTAFNSKAGGFQLTTVGRVQTPTLAILVDRERRSARSSARILGSGQGTFGAQAGEYTGRWFDEKFSGATDDPDASRRAAVGRGRARQESRASARAGGHGHRGVRSRPRRSRRCSTTSPSLQRDAERPLRLLPRAPRCRSRRRCTRSTRP
jgi:DNA topoisomerase-3